MPGPSGDADKGYTSILVTAEDGVTQKEYRMYYFAQLPDSTDATLLNLTVSEGELEPVFGSDILDYTVTVVDVEEITITATPTNPNAIVNGAGTFSLEVGQNIFPIHVTAEDEVTTLNYTVMVNRTLSIIEIQHLSNFKIYPNPTTGKLIINSEQLTMLKFLMFMAETYYHIPQTSHRIP